MQPQHRLKLETHRIYSAAPVVKMYKGTNQEGFLYSGSAIKILPSKRLGDDRMIGETTPIIAERWPKIFGEMGTTNKKELRYSK